MADIENTTPRPTAPNTLAELRAASRAAWDQDIHSERRFMEINKADSVYIPALEAEVDRLRGLAGESLLCDVKSQAVEEASA